MFGSSQTASSLALLLWSKMMLPSMSMWKGKEEKEGASSTQKPTTHAKRGYHDSSKLSQQRIEHPSQVTSTARARQPMTKDDELASYPLNLSHQSDGNQD